MAKSQDENVVTPVELAKEIGVRPQLVFSWARADKFPVHRCICNHMYLLRDEVAPFLAERDAKEAEKQAKIAAELEAASTDEADESEQEAVAS